ncbi:hypothetical protein NST07_06555 [Paenibacillus sp. FSL L8-0340]|uniref:hypothetical protein n=1 Tax=Paenibacillus sp. FSL L8-0340 TaxID=2954685 RepID=UPI0031586ADB
MKKTMIKAALAGSMLFSGVLGQVVVTNAAAAKPAATAAPVAPVVRDNLSNYGLKKDIELPVTVTAGGFSYTLEKIMIMETKSAAAQALIKKYGYSVDKKYFIWTKMTIANNSKVVVQQSSKDMSDKWRLIFEDDAYKSMPSLKADLVNNKEALWSWKLAPSQKLSTYQAYSYDGSFDVFLITVDNKKNSEFKYVVPQVK